MKVLILSPYADLIEDTISKAGGTPIIRSETMEVSDWPEADWVVSFGYRKIIQKRTIDQFAGRIINIHMSLLPWNRGAAPNFWSWFYGTPKGVTIHRVSEEIDKGEILAQSQLDDGLLPDFRYPVTLRTSYEDLLVAAAGLFNRSWLGIVHDRIELPMPNKSDGSYHKSGELDKFMRMLPQRWDTPVHEVGQLGWLYRGKK